MREFEIINLIEKKVKCEKCGTGMHLDRYGYDEMEDMSEGQEADYNAGFHGWFLTCPKCKMRIDDLEEPPEGYDAEANFYRETAEPPEEHESPRVAEQTTWNTLTKAGFWIKRTNPRERQADGSYDMK